MTSPGKRDERGWLPEACMCGHDHETHRGEHVDMCLDCSCDCEIMQCRNCGEEAIILDRQIQACSQACLRQLEWAAQVAQTKAAA